MFRNTRMWELLANLQALGAMGADASSGTQSEACGGSWKPGHQQHPGSENPGQSRTVSNATLLGVARLQNEFSAGGGGGRAGVGRVSAGEEGVKYSLLGAEIPIKICICNWTSIALRKCLS